MSNSVTFLRQAVVLLLASMAPSTAAILVTQTDKGFQFTEVNSISVNGKEKVLSVGGDPKAITAGKFPSVKLDGSLFRDRATSCFVLSSEGSLTYVIPEGLPKGTQPDLKQSWSGARLLAKGPDKIQADIPANTFVAFLPGDLPALVSVAKSDRELHLIDSSDKVFETQLGLISAIAKAYPKQPESAELRKYVGEAMRTRYEMFQNGGANMDTLNQALKFSELSEAAYKDVPEQAKLRDQIAQLKLWLDRKVAVLRALAAGSSWDQFIISDSDFDRYERSFPDLAQLRPKALQTSLDLHKKEGEELFTEGEYGAAFRQFRLASMRQPSDKLLQQRVVASWASYSREVALDHQRDRKQLGVGEREILNQAIQFATNYKNENKLELALKSIMDAEAQDPNSLPMLLKKAEILGAQSEFTSAFQTLDRYDLLAVDEERQKASDLRNELLFKQKSTVEDVEEQIQKALAEGRFVKVHELAMKGLRASDTDPNVLFEAATASLISRDTQQSRTFFQRYLTITNTLDSNTEQRTKVRTLLASSTAATAAQENGQPNWMSGKKLPADVFYCPISVAFQPKVDHIEASGKMRVAYEWSGDRLISITPSFEKAEKDTGEKKINFAYNDKFPQIISASVGAAAATVPTSPMDPDEVLKHSALVVLNNPYLNPDSVEKLTGKNVSQGISGNKFFEPFVWDRIHYFRFTYDSSGRVAHALELTDLNGGPTGFTLDFEWEGQHLTAIHGYQGIDANHRAKAYDRTMEYSDGVLVGEEISGTGKASHIKYNYNGGHLQSAQCTNDPTLDDRSRQVTFR